MHESLMSHLREKIAVVDMLLGSAEATSPKLPLHKINSSAVYLRGKSLVHTVPCKGSDNEATRDR